MQAVVILAVVVVIGAIAVPIYSTMQARAHQQVALDKIRTLCGALKTYAEANSGSLPLEDAPGNDTWHAAAQPTAKDAWYNALPRLLGKKGAGDYAPKDFYKDENLLFLPGANYPDKKKFLAPQFAMAINTKLERNDADGKPQRTKIDQVAEPARTVAFLEQGLLNEDRTLQVQTRNDYDGAPKGSAKSFIGRYGGKGVLGFFDGHAEPFRVKDILTESGQFPYPQAPVVWTRTPDENPNKGAATIPVAASAKN